MFTILYKFEVKPDHEETFEQAWAALTRLFYTYSGSLGSRLHKADQQTYIAYAQWPDKAAWSKGFKKLPEAAQVHRDAMKTSCLSNEILYKLDVVTDLLKMYHA